MKKIIEFIEKKLAPVAKKIAKDPRIKAMQTGFYATVGITILGSVCLLLSSPAVSSADMSDGILKTIIVGWEWIATTLAAPLGIIKTYTLDCVALYIVAAMGASLGKQYGLNPFVSMIVALFSFFTSCCVSAEGATGIANVGGSGLFSGLIVTVLSIELLRLLNKLGVGKFNLEKIGVPDALAASLDIILPVTIVGALLVGVGLASIAIFGVALPGILKVVLAPMLTAVDSVWFVIIYWTLTGLMWWVGIHDSTLYAAIETFYYMATVENYYAFYAGTPLNQMPYTFANGFWYYYLNYGVFSLCILCLLSKSKRIKTVGKISFIPSLFNIGEPIIFGLPIMLNTTLLIPMTIIAPINSAIAYFFTKAGLVNAPFFSPAANFIPNPILVFIETLDYKAVIMTIGLMILDVFIWLPFLKAYEKNCLEAETAEEIAEKA